MPRKATIHPFRNESESLQIGGLTIENRRDRVSLFGSLDITRDREGFAAAKALQDVLIVTLAELETADLPERIATVEPETVKNPFQ
jgi:hypothetical protein